VPTCIMPIRVDSVVVPPQMDRNCPRTDCSCSCNVCKLPDPKLHYEKHCGNHGGGCHFWCLPQ
jgi:hypothetical protein